MERRMLVIVGGVEGTTSTLEGAVTRTCCPAKLVMYAGEYASGRKVVASTEGVTRPSRFNPILRLFGTSGWECG